MVGRGYNVQEVGCESFATRQVNDTAISDHVSSLFSSSIYCNLPFAWHGTKQLIDTAGRQGVGMVRPTFSIVMYNYTYLDVGGNLG